MYDRDIDQLREAFVSWLYLQSGNQATKRTVLPVRPRMAPDQQIKLLQEIMGLDQRRAFALGVFVFGVLVGVAIATLLFILFLNC